MRWVKLHVAALRHPAYRRLSSDARLTFLACIGLAGECDAKGRLEIRGVGAMTISEIADVTGLTPKAQEKALQDVVAIGWMSHDATDTYVVERFEEKAGDVSNERVKRFRERNRNATVTLHETLPKRKSNGVDVEEDVEEDILPEIPKAAEGDVEVYLANAAAENKTGKITPSRANGLRRELRSLLAEVGEPAFIAGLREANARGVANRTYVKKCASSTSRRPSTKPQPPSRYQVLS